MIPIASRFKDALWSIRRRYGMESDIDRILPFIVFDQKIDQTALENLLVDYPKQVPEDFKSALIAQIQIAVRHFWQYRTNHKGYHKVLKGVIFLENIARHGFEGCLLISDKSVGYRLELKPEHRKKK